MVKEVAVFQFKNEKQNLFYDTVMRSVARLPGYDKTHFFYGGAIRGGKTFVCLFIFWILSKIYPGSRWYVIREDTPALTGTTIPSMQRLIGTEGPDFVWRFDKGNTRVVFNNGSRIFFQSENISKDKELKKFLGLEMNGVLLEQMEALNEKTIKRVEERIGSWYIDPMPIPLLLGTFNPDPGYVKKLIYDPFIRNELPEHYHYTSALPNDNPFVTAEQWKNWNNLDPESQRVMIKGIWTFKLVGNIWAYSFSESRHVRPAASMQINPLLPVYLVFDFNVDPMTCLVCQRDGMFWGKVIAEYRLRSSDIYEMCERIKTDLGEHYFIVTGDASGRNRSGQTRGAKSYVDILTNELNLSPRQVQFPLSNAPVKNTRVVVNSVLHKHTDFFISDACMWLIDDLHTVKTDGNGDIDKKKLDKLKTHLLDNLRYFIWNYFRNFVKIDF